MRVTDASVKKKFSEVQQAIASSAYKERLAQLFDKLVLNSLLQADSYCSDHGSSPAAQDAALARVHQLYSFLEVAVSGGQNAEQAARNFAKMAVYYHPSADCDERVFHNSVMALAGLGAVLLLAFGVVSFSTLCLLAIVGGIVYLASNGMSGAARLCNYFVPVEKGPRENIQAISAHLGQASAFSRLSDRCGSLFRSVKQRMAKSEENYIPLGDAQF